LLNGEPLTATRRITPGDELSFFGSRIVIGDAPEALLATAHLEDSAYITRPPELADDSAPADEAIAPSAFRRAAEVTAETPKPRAYRWQAAVGSAMVLLVVRSWLLFTSKSVQFRIEPGEPDEFSVTGG